jgi:hypothetical protein
MFEEHIEKYLDQECIRHRWWGKEKILSMFGSPKGINSSIIVWPPYYHRVDGPASIYYNKDGSISSMQYFILDKEITEEQFYTPGFIDAFILENS